MPDSPEFDAKPFTISFPQDEIDDLNRFVNISIFIIYPTFFVLFLSAACITDVFCPSRRLENTKFPFTDVVPETVESSRGKMGWGESFKPGA